MKKELLLYLAETMGCQCISDLKFIADIRWIKFEISLLSPNDFSLTDWNDAVNYFTGETIVFENEESAKEYLLKAKSINKQFV